MKTKKELENELERQYEKISKGYYPSQFQNGWITALEWVLESKTIEKEHGHRPKKSVTP